MTSEKTFKIGLKYQSYLAKKLEMNFVVLLFTIFAFCEAEREEIKCEIIEMWRYYSFGMDPPKTCFMNKETSISSQESFLASPKDETIEGFNLDENSRIYYLPANVAEKFPNLLVYSAHHCSILSVNNENFYNLIHLKQLILHDNKINRVVSNTFEGLTALEYLLLRK